MLCKVTCVVCSWSMLINICISQFILTAGRGRGNNIHNHWGCKHSYCRERLFLLTRITCMGISVSFCRLLIDQHSLPACLDAWFVLSVSCFLDSGLPEAYFFFCARPLRCRGTSVTQCDGLIVPKVSHTATLCQQRHVCLFVLFLKCNNPPVQLPAAAYGCDQDLS